MLVAVAATRDLALCKNMAIAPVALGMAAFSLLIIGIGFPMRIDHYPAVMAQLVSAYLIFGLLANVLSIIAPMPMVGGLNAGIERQGDSDSASDGLLDDGALRHGTGVDPVWCWRSCSTNLT